MKRVILSFVFLIFLTSCVGGATSSVTEGVSAFTPSPTVPIAPPPEKLVIPTPVLNPTATPDKGLPPEDWQDWPIVPTVTARAIEIYRSGLTMDLDPHAFSKVGDCQSIKAAFMGYFDIPERYPASLREDYPELQETVDNFAGHFNTDGQAVRGGFNAAAVLSPLWADPSACLAGENPLECELRLTKPIIVFVSLEVWWQGRTAQQYEVLMRQILDTIIAHGAVPILATKADNVEGDNSLNLTTAKLAYEYGLPLWNFWAAVQPLPNHGMDVKRNDGFHISTDAWSTRSFTALQALENVWHGLLVAGPLGSVATSTVSQPTATSASIATAAQTPLPTATPTPGPTPRGGSSRLVFGLAKRQNDGYEYQGIYLFDLTARQTTQIFGSGVRFQSASPDGRSLLVSEGASLYRTNVDGAYPVRLTDALYSLGDRDAIWLPDGRIAAILAQSSGTEITILSSEGQVTDQLPVSDASPITLSPTTDGKFIYWQSGSCASAGVCQPDGSWVSGLDGSPARALNGLENPVLAPDGSLLAAAVPSDSEKSSLTFALPDGSNPSPFSLPGDQLLAYAWSPSGNQLAAILVQVDNYSGRVTSNRNFLVDPRTKSESEFPPSELLSPRLVWSPDGSYLLRIGTLSSGEGFSIGGSLLERSSRLATNLGSAIGLADPDYLLVTNVAWLSLP